MPLEAAGQMRRILVGDHSAQELVAREEDRSGLGGLLSSSR